MKQVSRLLEKMGGEATEDQARHLFSAAVQAGVSDIHILPKTSEYWIYFRQAGKLHFMARHSLDWGKRLISYLKFLADLDVGEKRKPQSGATAFHLGEEEIELRLSTMTNFLLLESLVIRILRPMMNQASQMQTYFPKDLNRLHKLMARKSGLVLFSGPVGSGKTTMIYQLLRQRLAQEDLQVITMEDPVEIYEPNFLQAQVNAKAGITYDVLIKASLRHHPDILMIGEVRDQETARMMVRGALTGHLMIATIHAKNCLGVVARLEELQVSHQQLSQSLIGVISQRLVTRYCPNCQAACQKDCDFFPPDQKRASMFEVLEGTALKNYLDKGQTDYPNLNDKLRKAWAYGYIDQTTYQHFEVI